MKQQLASTSMTSRNRQHFQVSSIQKTVRSLRQWVAMVAFVHLLAVAGPVFIIASLAMPAGIGGQGEFPKDWLFVPLKGLLNQSNIGTVY